LRPAGAVDPAWQRSRRAGLRHAVLGAVLGVIVGVVAFAPATWMASAVNEATGNRLMLADARGTVWNGDAVLVLTGGADSQDAAVLPGRIGWRLRWVGPALELRARHACCLNGEPGLRLSGGLNHWRAAVLPPLTEPAGGLATIGQWPAGVLAGLGTPWNTLQLGGTLRLASEAAAVESAGGRVRLQGRAELELTAASSRLSTLPALGSYRLSADARSGEGGALLSLATLEGALQLNATGAWTPASGLRLRGQARAAQGAETALNNLLNIIGRRQGATATFAIG
jgi:general secretion pathway protein N